MTRLTVDLTSDLTPDYADRLITWGGVDIPVRAIPDLEERAACGVGHFPFDVHHRSVLPAPADQAWPYKPETCLTDLYLGQGGLWVDPEHLACRGCGLDFT